MISALRSPVFRTPGAWALVLVGCCLALSCRQLQAGVVSNCGSDDDLRAQVEAGGIVNFSCAGSVVIKLTEPLVISTGVTIDGSGRDITISSDDGIRLFVVQTNGSLTLLNVKLAGGQNDTDGGAAIFNRGTVYLQGCTLSENVATGVSGTDGRDSSNGGQIGGDGKSGSHGRRIAGGAVFNLGTFTAVECVFEDNRAEGGDGGSGGDAHDGEFRGGDGGDGGSGGAGLGGAIYSAGRLELYRCEFNRNSALGGDAGEGGALGDGAYAGVDGRGGKGGLAGGGAVFATNRTLVKIIGCTFALNQVVSGNSAAGGSSKNSGKAGPDGPGAFGGGVCNYGSAVVVNSTFSDNEIQAGNGGDGDDAVVKGGNGGNGGSAWGGSYFNGGTTMMTNCTIAGGVARPGTNGLAGSGAYSGRNGSRGTTRGANIGSTGKRFFLGHTILDNPESSSSQTTNVVWTVTTTNIYNLSGTTKADRTVCKSVVTRRLDGTLIRTNFSCADDELVGQNLTALTNSVTTSNLVVSSVVDNRSNAYGGIRDAGYNLLSDHSIKFSRRSTSRVDLDPDLNDLGDNGGPTRTMEPVVGSPAIDGGTTNAPPVLTDQIGGIRPEGDAVDIGAVEVGADLVDPPAITTQPVDFSVDAGLSAFFLVVADGTAPFGYQWFRSPASPIRTNGNAAFLTLPAVQKADEGGYYVVVSNRAGTATSRIASLTVNTNPPGVLDPTQPLDYPTLEPGAAVVLSFPTSGNGAYQWTYNGNVIPGANGSSLLLTNLVPTDSGSYQAIVTNRFGSVTSRAAAVTVSAAALEITGEPEDFSGYVGESLTLTCRTSGRGVYRWAFNGSVIPGATSSNLTLASLVLTNAGTYQAVVTNFAGSVTSRVAAVSVVDSAPLIVVAPPASTNVVLGQTLTLAATIRGSRPMTNQWYFVNASFETVPIPGATSTTLTLPNFQAANEGVYILQTLNVLGELFTDPCEVLRP